MPYVYNIGDIFFYRAAFAVHFDRTALNNNVDFLCQCQSYKVQKT